VKRWWSGRIGTKYYLEDARKSQWRNILDFLMLVFIFLVFYRFPNGANAMHINGQRVHALLLGIRNCK